MKRNKNQFTEFFVKQIRKNTSAFVVLIVTAIPIGIMKLIPPGVRNELVTLKH